MVLEVCVENVKSAINAWQGGAKRLELCSALCLGGLTPSLGMLGRVRRVVPGECDIFVMIRPNQSESFVYDEDEVAVMVEDIKLFKDFGVGGFVFGCLDDRKRIDKEICKKLLEAAGPLPSTFNRAFDIVENPQESLLTLDLLGFSRVLTSGQEKTAFLGRHLIGELVAVANEKLLDLTIVAGGGICPDNLREVLEVTKVKEYHGSARADLSSTLDGGIYVTDQSVVCQMVQIGESFYSRDSHRNK